MNDLQFFNGCGNLVVMDYFPKRPAIEIVPQSELANRKLKDIQAKRMEVGNALLVVPQQGSALKF